MLELSLFYHLLPLAVEVLLEVPTWWRSARWQISRSQYMGFTNWLTCVLNSLWETGEFPLSLSSSWVEKSRLSKLKVEYFIFQNMHCERFFMKFRGFLFESVHLPKWTHMAHVDIVYSWITLQIEIKAYNTNWNKQYNRNNNRNLYNTNYILFNKTN